jgi:NRAMP (natural resistance-associated macrophage protein)-like metal ion transporter
LGPGLIAGSADDDPSGIGTYAIAGATLGYATLWTALFTIPMMIAIQLTCAKIAMVTRLGLAGAIRRHYSGWVLYPTMLGLLVANTINAGADLGAIGAGVELVMPIPSAAVVVLAGVGLLLLEVVGSYATVEKTFKWLTLTLFAYLGAAVFAHPDWSAALFDTVRPTLSVDKQYLATIVALFGTVMSPYLFVWQAAEEVEEMQADTKRRRMSAQAITRRLHDRTLDVATGMGFSNLITYFVILATAATLHQAGQTDVTSAADAARALEPIAGNAAGLLFAAGLIGAGALAVPVLTASAAYAIAGGERWRVGLDQPVGKARGFYGVILVATILAVGINFIGISPIQALFISAVINGVLAPPLMVLLMLIANRRSAMGDHTHGVILNLVGWATIVVMSAAALGLLVTGAT